VDPAAISDGAPGELASRPQLENGALHPHYYIILVAPFAEMPICIPFGCSGDGGGGG
jgi:hypothetical protein